MVILFKFKSDISKCSNHGRYNTKKNKCECEVNFLIKNLFYN